MGVHIDFYDLMQYIYNLETTMIKRVEHDRVYESLKH